MSLFVAENAHQLWRALRESPSRAFGSRSRVAQHINYERDVLEQLVENPLLRRRIRDHHGHHIVRSLEKLHQETHVSHDLAQQLLDWLRRPPSGPLEYPWNEGVHLSREFIENGPAIIGDYKFLQELLDGSGIEGIGRILDRHHIVKDAHTRALRDGLMGYSTHVISSPGRRTLYELAGTTGSHPINVADIPRVSSGRPTDDALSILVARDEPAAYRLGRRLKEVDGGFSDVAPWLVKHAGEGGLHSRLARYIPDTAALADFSLRDILDHLIWVHVHELGLPPVFKELIRDDLIRSLIIAMREGRGIPPGSGLDAINDQAIDFVEEMRRFALTQVDDAEWRSLHPRNVRQWEALLDPDGTQELRLVELMRRALPVDQPLPIDFAHRWQARFGGLHSGIRPTEDVRPFAANAGAGR